MVRVSLRILEGVLQGQPDSHVRQWRTWPEEERLVVSEQGPPVQPEHPGGADKNRQSER